MPSGYIDPSFDANAAQVANQLIQILSGNSGYISAGQLDSTPQGRSYIDDLWQKYLNNYNSGASGYGLPGGTGGDPNKLRSTIQSALTNPNNDPDLYNWIQQQGGMPQIPTFDRDKINMADKLARDMQAAQDKIKQYEVDTNNQLQRDLQAGLITHQTAMEQMKEAHEKALQANDLAYKYADLAWQKEYGTQNIQLLHDRLAWDREFGTHQLANDDQRVGIEKDRLGLDKDKFALDKSIQEAGLRANPLNAVQNALYTRGTPIGMAGSNDMTQFGQSTMTLDNSGVLPYLQQLMNGGIQNPSQQNGPALNQQGIGGNIAPNPNQISQLSYNNMSDIEKGINQSLASYGGYNPADYWKSMQNSWNTAGQKNLGFGTRIA